MGVVIVSEGVISVCHREGLVPCAKIMKRYMGNIESRLGLITRELPIFIKR